MFFHNTLRDSFRANCRPTPCREGNLPTNRQQILLWNPHKYLLGFDLSNLELTLQSGRFYFSNCQLPSWTSSTRGQPELRLFCLALQATWSISPFFFLYIAHAHTAWAWIQCLLGEQPWDSSTAPGRLPSKSGRTPTTSARNLLPRRRHTLTGRPS